MIEHTSGSMPDARTPAGLSKVAGAEDSSRRDAVFTSLWRSLRGAIPDAVELRERLHRQPCLSGYEHATVDLISSQLTDIEVVRVAETGLVASVGPLTGPAIALRAELDALPVTERTGSTFSSMNRAMHACGHDVHMAALVGMLRAARTVQLPYRLVGIFQPREETYPSGAKDLLDAGVLESFDVEHVIGAHVHPSMRRGTVSIAGGFVNAAADELRFRFEGVGGHGAYPEAASDVIAAMSHVSTSLPELTRRSVPQLSPAVISVGTIRAGDGAANVLPGTGEMLAIMRTAEDRDRDRLIEAVRRVVDGISRAFDVVGVLDVVPGEPALHNDHGLAEEMTVLLDARGYRVDGEPMRSLGADDFSFFSSQRPSVMAFVGVDIDGAGRTTACRTPMLHDPAFLPTADAVGDVASVLASGYLAAVQRLDGESCPSSLL